MTRLAIVKQERDTVQRQLSLYQAALRLAMRSQPDHVERFKWDDGCRYELSGYGLTLANGGIVITRFICPGQSDSIQADHLDDLLDTYQAHAGSQTLVQFAIAAQRINVARYRLLNQEKTA